MKPSQVASKLRRIAAAIDNSKNPRPDLVAADLRRIVANMPPDAILKSIGDVGGMAEMIRMVEKRQDPDASNPDEFFHQFIWAYAEDADSLTEKQLAALRETFDEAFSQYTA